MSGGSGTPATESRSFSALVRGLEEMVARLNGHGVGKDRLCQLADLVPEILLVLGVRPGMDRPWGHMPKIETVKHSAHAFCGEVHVETAPDPLPEHGNRPARRSIRFRVRTGINPRHELRGPALVTASANDPGVTHRASRQHLIRCSGQPGHAGSGHQRRHDGISRRETWCLRSSVPSPADDAGSHGTCEMTPACVGFQRCVRCA